MKSVNTGVLKNRRLALDLLEFLDSQKPSWWDLNDWNDQLVTKMRITQVPGMGQFDVDGLDSSQQSQLIEGTSKILGYATLIVLLFGVSAGTVVYDKIFSYHEQASSLISF